MEEKTRKVIAIFVSLVFLLNMQSIAYASECENLDSENDVVTYIWVSLRDNGKLFVNDDGLLSVDDNNEFKDVDEYKRFLELIDLSNELIERSVLAADRDTAQLTTVVQIDEDLMPDDSFSLSYYAINYNEFNLKNASHGCSYGALDLLGLCHENYNIIVGVYNDLRQIEISNPGASAWTGTVGYWISKVQEGGDWDYKNQPGYSPYSKTFCSYYDGTYHHITSEYIGNFNYGYTGSFLFTLDVLHFGSSAVAGFDPADKSDWPAIDAGYSHAA